MHLKYRSCRREGLNRGLRMLPFFFRIDSKPNKPKSTHGVSKSRLLALKDGENSMAARYEEVEGSVLRAWHPVAPAPDTLPNPIREMKAA